MTSGAQESQQNKFQPITTKAGCNVKRKCCSQPGPDQSVTNSCCPSAMKCTLISVAEYCCSIKPQPPKTILHMPPPVWASVHARREASRLFLRTVLQGISGHWKTQRTTRQSQRLTGNARQSKEDPKAPDLQLWTLGFEGQPGRSLHSHS